jgi:hypothetical protein
LRKLILTVLFVGVLSNTFCGPVNQPVGLDQENQAGRLRITTAKVPIGIVGNYYSVHLTAAGGVSPYHWAISDGTLPAGLVLDSATGEVSGTPKQFTRATLLLRVEDSGPAEQQESTAMMPVAIDPDHLMIVTPGMPQAIIGKPYTFKLEAAGGAEPYTWSVKGGSLPSGLELNSQSGVINGKPTQGGTSSFTMQVTDSSSPPVSIAYRFPPLPEADISAR